MAIYRIKRFSSQQISFRKPYIEISKSQSSSSSFYDSERPEDNYHYESNQDYYDNSNQKEPEGYEEKIIETPKVSIKESNSTDKSQSFKEKVKKIMEEKSGMNKDEVLDKYFCDFRWGVHRNGNH